MIDQETLNKFDMLYKQTYDDVLKCVVCSCHNIDNVNDIIQNIYLAVFNKLQKKHDIDKVYIMGICKNKIKDYYRFNYKEKIISLFSAKNNIEMIDTIPSNINIEEDFILKYDTEMVWNYLKKKKIIIFKVFYLYFKLELTIKEIAQELNITESNVKHYLYRTLKELNKYFQDRGDENV